MFLSVTFICVYLCSSVVKMIRSGLVRGRRRVFPQPLTFNFENEKQENEFADEKSRFGSVGGRFDAGRGLGMRVRLRCL
jgi:hypothetical protein